MFQSRWQSARKAVLVAALAALAVAWSVGDASAKKKSPNPSDTGAANGVAHRVAVAYPLQLSVPVPSVRRYLDAIDNGERLRERAVVAAAARATLERAKAEAAAAVAGQEQPWITTAPGAPEAGVVPPGAILPGAFLQILGTPYSTFADDDGHYRLTFDPSLVGPCRTQVVRVTATGYRAQNLILAVGSADNTILMSRRSQ